MSAPARASNETLAEPVPPIASPTASSVRVLIPGTWRTFENREVLRGMGLRWDPPAHAWHGALTPHERSVLRDQFGLAIRPVVALEAFQGKGEFEALPNSAPQPSAPTRPPRGPSLSQSSLSNPPSRVHDGSRTRAEARIALKPGVAEPDDQEARYPSDAGRVFSWWETTSGLPDDSREADERAEERGLRDLRGRVKAARAALSCTKDLAELLATDATRSALFHRRFGVTPTQLRTGVPASPGDSDEPPHDAELAPASRPSSSVIPLRA